MEFITLLHGRLQQGTCVVHMFLLVLNFFSWKRKNLMIVKFPLVYQHTSLEDNSNAKPCWKLNLSILSNSITKTKNTTCSIRKVLKQNWINIPQTWQNIHINQNSKLRLNLIAFILNNYRPQTRPDIIILHS